MSTGKYIGTQIRLARERRGLSLRDAGQQMGTSHTTIAEWEKGTRPIQFEDLERLAKVLERPVQFFLPDWYVDPRNLSPDLASLVNRINELPHGPVRDKLIRNIVDQIDNISGALGGASNDT